MVFTSTSKLLSIVTQTFLHVANFPPLQTIFLTPPPPIFKIHTPSPRILLRTTFYDSPINNRNNFSSCTFFFGKLLSKNKDHSSEWTSKQKENQKRQIIFSLSNKDPFQQSLPSPFWLFDSNFREQKLRQRFGLWWKLELFVVVLGQLLKILIPTFTLVGCWIKDGERKKTKASFVVDFFPWDIAILKILPFVQILPYFVTSSFGFEYCLSISWGISLDIIMFQFCMLLSFFFSRFFALSRATDIYFGSTQSVLQLLHSSTLGVSHSLCNYLIQQRPV